MAFANNITDLNSINKFKFNLHNQTYDNSSYGANGALTGSIFSTTNCKIYNGTSGCFRSSADGNYVEFSSSSGLSSDLYEPNANLNYTVTWWMNTTGSTDFQFPFTSTDAGAETGFEVFMDSSETGQFQIRTAPNNKYQIGYAIATDTWDFYEMILNVTAQTLYLYKNQVLVGTASRTAEVQASAVTAFRVGHQNGQPTRDFKGGLQALYFFNRTLTQNERDFLYNNGNGRILPDGVVSEPVVIINNTLPVINISYPTNGWTINNNTLYPLLINGTVSVQNGSISSLTINNTNFRNLGNATNFNFTLNGTAIEGLYSLSLTATSNYGNTTTSYLNFTLDISLPSISTTLANNFTMYYIYQNITFQANFSDNIKVYSFNITNTEGYSVVYSGVNVTNYIYNASINVSTYNLGMHNLSLSVCDAHTKQQIEDYDIIADKTNKEVRVNVNNGYFKIYPKDKTLVSDVKTTKSVDRYRFSFTKNPLNKKNNQTFIVESDSPIDVIGNENNYYAWMVIRKYNKWVDFNSIGLKGDNYELNQINLYKVEVRITNIQNDEMQFESIGDLNCITKSYRYYLFNYTAVYEPTAIETVVNTFKLIIDYKDLFLRGNGTLNYYTSSYNTSNFSSTNQVNLTLDLTIPQIAQNETNVSFNWNFMLNSSTFQTINFTQLVSRIRLTDCSVDGTPTLKINIFNEKLPTQYLEAEIDQTFTIWTNDSTNTVNFSFSFADNTNYSICIYPNTSMYVNSDMFYNTTGGFRQRWFLRSARLNTNLSTVNLYNFNSQTGISTLKGTLKDTNYANYGDIITKLQRRYPAENVWRTVQMDKSDEFGLVIFNIVETSQDYQLLFEENNAQIDSTDILKFLCTSGLCDVTFIVTKTSTSSTPNLAIQSAYNNATQVYQLNFSDTTGLTSSVQLRVLKESGSNLITICDTTVQASSGSINCNTTGYNGRLKVEVYSSASPYRVILSEFISKIYDRLYQQANNNGALSNNEMNLWGMMISITLIVAGSFVSIIIGIIAYIISLIVLFYMGLVNFITIGVITISIFLSIVVAYMINKRYGS